MKLMESVLVITIPPFTLVIYGLCTAQTSEIRVL